MFVEENRPVVTYLVVASIAYPACEAITLRFLDGEGSKNGSVTMFGCFSASEELLENLGDLPKVDPY